ncbi:hypothetical protein PLICRDRAFT_412095 [Plicaturopsis crispa FD-325 SS-3]|nr:hypothetical protein PLICRDRAFT_412095 [Plicaturopsis crispa FD-325 SS-3]
MPSRAISVSSPTLLQACVAYLSPELQSLDTIIRLRSQHILCIEPHITRRTTFASLSPEILLIVRTYLYAELFAACRSRARFSLARYETSIRELLCPGCQAYRDEVFGTDVWGWENFTGPCMCLEGKRLSCFGSRKPSQIICNSPIPTVKLFATRSDWLEDFLSNELRRLSAGPKHIWNAVSAVLHEFSCKAITQHANSTPRSPHSIDTVHIVSVEEGEGVSDLEWQTEVNLRKAERNLLLPPQTTDDWLTFGSHPTICKEASRSIPAALGPSFSTSFAGRLLSFNNASFLQMLICIIFSPFLAVALLFCFYRRPGCLKSM